LDGNLLGEIIIEKGIKQGDPLSMWLYTIAIQELFLIIKQDFNIKGYKLNIISQEEIKLRGYADDVKLILIDNESIRQAFKVFEYWGNYSGGVINKEKTKILNINGFIDDDLKDLCVDETRILGIVFDKNGISDKNLNKVMTQIDNMLILWNLKNFDMLQRITALKTFILSKLWFILNFVVLKRNQIIILERKIYQYVWNNKMELIKRKTLIKSKLEGGLDMIDIFSKIQSIYIKQYIYLLNNHQKVEYQYGLKWLKFKMRKFVKNINSIPGEDESFISEYYENIKNIHDKYKVKIDLIQEKNLSNNLKSIYIIIKKDEEIKPRIENNIFQNDKNWLHIYKKVLYKKIPSKYKIFNYKILFNIVSTTEKFNKSQKCNFCNQENSNILDHLFFKCKKLQAYGESILSGRVFELLNKDNLFYLENIEEDEIFSISKFKYDIWLLYKRSEYNKNYFHDMIKIFNALNFYLKY
jgi:hypothetical protein